MAVTPLICQAPDEVIDLSAQLKRSGLDVRVVPLDEPELPESSHYIVWDCRTAETARRWSRQGGATRLNRTIACGRLLNGRDILRLDDLGIRYACNTHPNIDGLLRLVGYIDAETISTRKERIAEAHDVANTVFNATTAAFGMFASVTHYDATFYENLSSEFDKRLKVAPLMLLVDAISANQETTIQHCSLVTTIAVAFGGVLGLGAADMERLFLSAFFHDIGKSVVPKHVIDKPGKLTPDEIRLVRSHVTVGYEMLRRFPETAGEIADVALYHHEMLDGSGYPNGLKGGEISDLIRLVTICDVFAALIERRSYKPPMPAREAYGILQSMGPKLDQALVAVFGEVVESLA